MKTGDPVNNGIDLKVYGVKWGMVGKNIPATFEFAPIIVKSWLTEHVTERQANFQKWCGSLMAAVAF